MYCYKCGEKLNDNMNFCSNCGMKLDNMQITESTPNYSQQSENSDCCVPHKTNTVNRKSMTVWYIICFVFSGIYFIMGSVMDRVMLIGMVFFLILGIMFVVLSKSPKEIPFILGANKGLTKTKFVWGHIGIAFLLTGIIMYAGVMPPTNKESTTTYEFVNTEHDIQTTPSPKIEVIVLSKNNISKDIYAGRYSDRVEFNFSISNNTEKDIKGIEGTLYVKDMFENKIIQITCDFTGKTIPANGNAEYTNFGLDLNQFLDNHTKLYNEKYEDLIFEYNPKSIVYTDGSTEML